MSALKRAASSLCSLALALTATGCGGLGSVASAGSGEVRYVLTTVVQKGGDDAIFGGLAVSDDGTAYLGVADDTGYLDQENVRILIMRRGAEPRVLLREQDVTLQYVDSLEPRVMTIGKDGELLIAAYGDGIVSVVVTAPGMQRVIPGPPAEDRDRYGREVPGLAADRRDGTVYFADRCRVWRAGPGGSFEFFAGERPDTRCLATDPAQVHLVDFQGGIGGLAVDPRSGALYVSDDAQVHRIDASGVTTVAGRARRSNADINRGFSGDGGPATAARLDEPGSLAVDPATGDLYIADQKNQRIRKVDAAGTITTAVGNGATRRPYEGRADDVAVDAVQVAIDGQGHLWATASPEGSSARDIWSNRLITATLPRPGGG